MRAASRVGAAAVQEPKGAVMDSEHTSRPGSDPSRSHGEAALMDAAAGAHPDVAVLESKHRVLWMFERRRVLLSALFALAAAAVAVPLALRSGHFSFVDAIVLVLFVYLVAHLNVTTAVFSGATRQEIDAWAQRDSRGPSSSAICWAQRPARVRRSSLPRSPCSWR